MHAMKQQQPPIDLVRSEACLETWVTTEFPPHIPKLSLRLVQLDVLFYTLSLNIYIHLSLFFLRLEHCTSTLLLYTSYTMLLVLLFCLNNDSRVVKIFENTLSQWQWSLVFLTAMFLIYGEVDTEVLEVKLRRSLIWHNRVLEVTPQTT